jgi:pimeloyl-ACP methyl ester carboxylesterase
MPAWLPLAAQGIEGSWKGTLKVSTVTLPLVFHIRDSAGHLVATMDSPNQHAYGVPVTTATFQTPQLHLELAPQHIVYDGQLGKSADSITGTFTQAGKSFPLDLVRTALASTTAVRDTQEPKKPYPYLSEDVRFQNPQAHITLAGTLTLPRQKGPFPAVVLITGSGPQDRNETLMGHKPFLVISDYLTRRGIAVLRFDDRGTAESGGNFGSATTADFATDVEAAVSYLHTRKQIIAGRVGLVGHSEGGLIAAMVAAMDKHIDFIVMLAGPGLTGEQVLLTQQAAIAKAMGVPTEAIARQQQGNEKAFRLITEISDTTALKDSLTSLIEASLPGQLSEAQREKAVSGSLSQLTSPWMRYFLKTDPSVYLKKVSCPVLALDGTHDLQVLPGLNIPAIEKALAEGGNKRVTVHVFPGLNHLFQQSKTGLPGEYASSPETFAPIALQTMTDWIVAQVK